MENVTDVQILEFIESKVKEAKKEHGTPIEALCTKAGISKRSYYYLIGGQKVKPSTRNKMLGCFGCKLEIVTIQSILKINP